MSSWLPYYFREGYKGILFQQRKKEMLGMFQKGNKVFDKTFASLGTTIKLTNETIDCETRKFRLVTLRAINKK